MLGIYVARSSSSSSSRATHLPAISSRRIPSSTGSVFVDAPTGIMRSFFGVAACLLPLTHAIFPDEAYNIDYQYALLGIPQQHTTFFHPPSQSSKASLIYTLSEQGIVGAVNPKDGSVVWRQRLAGSGNSSSTSLRAGEDQEYVISGAGKKVTAWTASDGRFVWSNQVESPGLVKDLEILEIPEGASGQPSKDIVAVFDGESPVVQRLDWKTGIAKWQYTDNR
jgi:outer membrane protein assembly factor BamB